MRTAPRKRPLALLDVLESVRRQVPAGRPIRAVLVGAGPLDRAVRRRIERPGLADWVTATGRLERAGIRRLLERADLYVAPARQESFGIAALEARCAGLPVVGMAGTGLAEFVSDGLDGFLVGSDQEMAAKVAALVRDPVELAAAQEAARRPVPGLGWPAVLARHRALYAAVASARAPVPAGTRPGTADPA